MRASVVLALLLAACARPYSAPPIDMPPLRPPASAYSPPYPDLLPGGGRRVPARPNDAAETPAERDYLADMWLVGAGFLCKHIGDAEVRRLIGAVMSGPTYRAVPLERMRVLNTAAQELLRREGTTQCDTAAAELPSLRARMRAAAAPRAAPRPAGRPEPPDTGWQPTAPAPAPPPATTETLDL